MNNNLLLVGVLICLVVGTGAGYFVGSSPLQGLQKQVADYQVMISRYERYNTTAQNQIDEYESQITRYQNQVSGLQDQVNYYQSQISYLQSITTGLQDDVTELNHIVNMEMSTALEQSKAVNIPRASSVTYSYSTLYSGYITVNFISSGGVHFFIGNSEYGFYARFPVSAPDHYGSGSFTIPVGRETTTLQIVNPIGTSTLDVTFSVVYVY